MTENKVSTLFLDIGGVLLSKGWGHEFRYQAADKFGLDRDEMEDRHHEVFVPHEEGRMTLAEYLDIVVFYKKREFTYQQFRDYMCSLSTADNEMIAFIKALKAQHGLKIVAVNNESRELNNFRINKFGLNEFIDFFVSSCYIDRRKPGKGIFDLALELAQVAKEAIVYIDDTKMFVEVGQELGLTSIAHKNWEDTAKQLASLGLALR
ncbi:MAG: hypothetical protein JWQ27_2300 [Ferruginibacter sp.]|nr:hypothetical protein [Ferruginibacter sp.]